jgi:hypothetical protein
MTYVTYNVIIVIINGGGKYDKNNLDFQAGKSHNIQTAINISDTPARDALFKALSS